MAQLTTEVATTASDPYLPSFTTVMTPTDPTLKGKSQGVALYDEIRRDPHAFAILQKRKLEVVSREWQVYEASESALDKTIAEEVTRQVKSIKFDRVTRGLMGAVLKGYAVAEVIWAKRDGLWVIHAIKVKKQRRFRFGPDGELRMLTRAKPVDGESVPDKKFIVHRHSIDDDDDDPYGVGLGSVLYWPAWFKRQALAHWLRGVEKHAYPTVKATYPGAYDETRQAQMLAAIRKLGSDTGISVPENVILELMESKGTGSAEYEKINRYLDEMMSEAVLGETLTTNAGDRGARSLGEVHDGIRVAIAKADSDLVCETFRETAIRWMVELNWPGAAIPELWRDFAEAEDLDARVDRDKKIYDMGYEPADPQYFDDTYGGEWQKRAAPAVPASLDGKPAPVDTSATGNLEFAENTVRNGDRVTAEISDQVETFAQPAIDAMVAQIRTEFTEARDYDDLILRLAGLSASIGVDDLAGVLEQAGTLAQLEGHLSAGANG